MTIRTDVVDSLAAAFRAACQDLLGRHQEHFYYITFVVPEGFARPVLSAWSWEALNRRASTAPEMEVAKKMLKWSYADSPYYNFGEGKLKSIEKYFKAGAQLYDLNAAELEKEVNYRVDSVEAAVKRLDSEGVFGTGKARNRIAVLVEVMPPDHSNTRRGIRLNPPEAIANWLSEAAE